MQNRLLYFIKGELIYYRRSVGPWIGMLVIQIYIALISFFFMSQDNFYLSLTCNTYSTQSAILLFIMLGIRMGQAERHAHCDEVYQSYSNSDVVIVPAKLISGFLCALVFSLTHFLMNTLILLFFGGNSGILLHIFSFILLYYFIPLCISICLGLFLSRTIHSRMIYVLALLLSIVIGPLNESLYSFIFGATLDVSNDSLQYFFNLLNLGQHEASYRPDIYLLPVEPVRWLVRSALLIIAMMLLFSTLLSTPRRFVKRFAAVLPIILLFALFLLTNTLNHRRFFEYNDPANYASRYDYAYYSRDKSQSVKSANSLKPLDYTIDLNVGIQNVDVKVSMTLQAECQTDRQIFTLYRDFHVLCAKTGGEEPSFQQNGDYLEIQFPDILNAGDITVIEMVYSGCGSPEYPASRYDLSLDRRFPWLPYPGLIPQAKPGSRSSLREITWDQPVRYELNCRMPQNEIVFCNLPARTKNQWAGSVNSGLMIYSNPMMRLDPSGSAPMYYPAQIGNRVALCRSVWEKYSGLYSMLGLDPAEQIDMQKPLVFAPAPIDAAQDFFQGFYIAGCGEYNICYLDDSSSLLYYDNRSPEDLACSIASCLALSHCCYKGYVNADSNALATFDSLCAAWLKYRVTGDMDVAKESLDNLYQDLVDKDQIQNREAKPAYRQAADAIANIRDNLSGPGSMTELHAMILRWYALISSHEPFRFQDMISFFREEGLLHE